MCMKCWNHDSMYLMRWFQSWHLSGGFHDIRKAVRVVSGYHHDVPELSANHEEADSSMFLHIAHVKKTLGIDRVVSWSLDLEVACICPRYCSMTGTKELYLKTGIGQKKRFVPMHSITAELGEDTAHVLPSIHSFSSCDSTSAFSGMGKEKWMKAVIEHP